MSSPPAPHHEPLPRGDAPGRGPRSLWKETAWSVVGEVGYAGGSFAVLVLLAQLGSVEALGQYTLGLAIATPAILATNLHLRPAYVVDPGRWGYGAYLGVRRLSIPLALLLTAMVALIAGYDTRTVLVVMAVAGLRAWESVSDILLAPAQRAEHMAAVGRSRAARGLLTAGGLAVGLALTGDALWGLGLALLLLAGLSLGHDRATARRFGPLVPDPPSRALWSLARHTLPIGMAATLLSAATTMPSVALEYTHDLTTLGFLGAVLSIMYVGNVLNVALGNATIPRLARHHTRSRTDLRRLLLRLLLVVAGLNALLVLGTIGLGEHYLRWVYGEAFVAYTPALWWAAVAAAVAGLANMMSQAITAMGRFRDQLRLNAVALVGSAVATALLVPRYGLGGAVFALLVLASMRLCLYLALTWRTLAAPRRRPAPPTDRALARA